MEDPHPYRRRAVFRLWILAALLLLQLGMAASMFF